MEMNKEMTAQEKLKQARINVLKQAGIPLEALMPEKEWEEKMMKSSKLTPEQENEWLESRGFLDDKE